MRFVIGRGNSHRLNAPLVITVLGTLVLLAGWTIVWPMLQSGHCIKIRSATDFQVIAVLWKSRHDYVESLKYSPDGRFLASATSDATSDVTMTLWDTRSGEAVWSRRGVGDVCDCVFSNGGRTLLAACRDGWLRSWDVSSGRPGRSIRLYRGGLWCAGFSRDGTLVAVCTNSSRSQHVLVARTKDGAHVLDRACDAQWLALSPDGGTLALAVDKKVDILKVRGDVFERSLLGVRYSVRTIAFSANGRLLVGTDGNMYAWRISDGVLVHRAPADAKEPSWYFLFAPPAFSPDGRRFVAPGNALIIWDLLTGRAYSVDTGAVSLYMATAVAFSPDGRSLAVGEDYFSRP